MDWIRKPDYHANNITVHEVKCPLCKYCETYLTEPPKRCYCCGAKLEKGEST